MQVFFCDKTQMGILETFEVFDDFEQTKYYKTSALEVGFWQNLTSKFSDN